MASSPSLLFFLSPLVIYFLALSTIAQLELQYHDCYNNNSKYTTDSPYEANLNHLLSSLSTKIGIDYGFYNFSYGEGPDRAYAIGICRPDMEPDSCRNCINEASQNLPSICPNSVLAIAGFDDRGFNNCMLRYANYNIFHQMENTPYFFVHATVNITENLVEFNQTRNRLLERLISEATAPASPHKYAVGEEPVKDILSLYALVQCNPDLSEDDCNRCLYNSKSFIPQCCDVSVDGRVITPSCNFRYGTSKFYKPSIEEGTPVSPAPSTNPKGKKKHAVVIIVCSVVGSVILIMFIGCSIFLKMRKSEEENEDMDGIENIESLQFNFSTIRDATNNFSDENKLGQGVFGAVYKGILSDGQQIAVKRLSINSNQGDLKFKNEVLLMVKLQHRNLVRLLGFCLEQTERILVYEFIPNSSLDRLIFDFGMARLFQMDQTQSSTNRVVGTFGYMAPEYVMHGRISVKSDVYSFGILILEIMSGQRISSFGVAEETEGLVPYAWRSWNEGTASNLIDPTLRDGSTDEMMKCIHIGLLCVQESVSDRPTMASVVVMLSSKNDLTLPAPSKPGFFLQNSVIHETSSSQEHNCRSTKSNEVNFEAVPLSRNEVSITELHPR